jgi:hypothetical protein
MISSYSPLSGNREQVKTDTNLSAQFATMARMSRWPQTRSLGRKSGLHEKKLGRADGGDVAQKAGRGKAIYRGKVCGLTRSRIPVLQLFRGRAISTAVALALRSSPPQMPLSIFPCEASVDG